MSAARFLLLASTFSFRSTMLTLPSLSVLTCTGVWKRVRVGGNEGRR